MNELPVIGSLCLRKDLRDHRATNISTHSISKNVWRKVFSTSKKTIWREIIALSSLFYQKWIWVMLIQGKRKFLFEQP